MPSTSATDRTRAVLLKPPVAALVVEPRKSNEVGKRARIMMNLCAAMAKEHGTKNQEGSRSRVRQRRPANNHPGDDAAAASKPRDQPPASIAQRGHRHSQ